MVGEGVSLLDYSSLSWKRSVNGAWINKEVFPEYDPDNILITYQAEKSKDHLVPIIIPADTHHAMKFLVSDEARKNADVSEDNKFVFGCTKHSKSHVSGWHSVNNILIKLGLAGTINGTRNRHRVSTLFIDMGLLENEKHLIYDHFGHSEQIHKQIYQAPPAHKQFQLTGKYLQRLDEASHTKGKHVTAVDT